MAFADFFRRPTLLLPRAGARAGAAAAVFLLVDLTLDGATGGAFLVRPGGAGGLVERAELR